MQQKYSKLIFVITMIVIIILGSIGAEEIIQSTVLKSKCSIANCQKSKQENNKMDLKLSKDTVIKLAEIILEAKFGSKILQQKPWIVTENDANYKIVGTFHGGVNALGGVVEIVISKSDAQVLSMMHGK